MTQPKTPTQRVFLMCALKIVALYPLAGGATMYGGHQMISLKIRSVRDGLLAGDLCLIVRLPVLCLKKC